jgi:hypothetical protein
VVMQEPALVHEILDQERSVPLASGERNELPVSLALWRRFVGVVDGEMQEVIAMVRGRPWVGYARSESEQVDMLLRAQRTRDYSGAYLLFNPIDSRISERYAPGEWGPAHAGRASDKEILLRRAVFVDVDPIRPKGISATDEERSAARLVAMGIRELLESRCGADAVGWGSSGNGYYLLVAIVPVIPDKDHGIRIKRLLGGLQTNFGNAAVSIDGSVFNAARLMAAPGTLKAKGAGSEARPHRLTSFCCTMNAPVRVPLEVIA